jgi:hypothetical protein
MTDLTWHKQLRDMGFKEVDRQNYKIKQDYDSEIQSYKRQLETVYMTSECLEKHNITPTLRARMVDWMIEVLTNFKCDD